jgi:tRNA(fMet)-specific endonuclease VapC
VILIDTDVCIEILRKNDRVIAARDARDDDVAVSFMSVAELFYGSAKSSSREHNDSLITEFLLTVEVVQTDLPILRRFADLKSVTRDQGLLLPDADLLMAATAIEKAQLLVTGNTRHFERIPDLRIENWIR